MERDRWTEGDFHAFGVILLVLLAAIAILAFIPTRAWSAPAEMEKLQKEVLGPVVQIERFCSGFIFSSKRDSKSGDVRTLVLTARHCITDTPEKVLTIYVPVYQKSRVVSEQSYRVRVLGQYYKGDVALLELTDKQTFFDNTVALAAKDVELFEGEDVWAVGYPLGLGRTITRGMFGGREYNDFIKTNKSEEYFRSTPQLAGGNSGGPLFHKNAAGDYEVIGLATASVRSADFINYETPIDVIQDYLAIAVPAEKPPATPALRP